MSKAATCNCPKCGHLFQAATGVAVDVDPVEGDLSVCLYCGAYLEFNKNLTVKALTDSDFEKLPMEVKNKMWQIRVIRNFRIPGTK